MTASKDLLEVVLNLAWDQWTRLGVRGASATYLDGNAVGLEELMILTSTVAAEDPRLQNEALDWCVKNTGLISKPRLKGLLSHFDQSTYSQFVRFSTALTHHVGGHWPGAESSRKEDFPTLTSKSAFPPLMHAELIQLRIRMAFGVNARADLLSMMLAYWKSELGASDFRYLGYTKRNISSALNALQSGGILEKSTRGNQLLFRWKRREELIALVAPIPARFPVWLPLVRFMIALLQLCSDLDAKSPRLARVAATNQLRGMTHDLETLRLSPPKEGPIDLELLTNWIVEITQELKTPNSRLFETQV